VSPQSSAWQARYLMLPVVWLGQYIEKKYEYSVPANDNCWVRTEKRG
jgi:hypothetical protein